jgi:hypothetical protein
MALTGFRLSTLRLGVLRPFDHFTLPDANEKRFSAASLAG